MSPTQVVAPSPTGPLTIVAEDGCLTHLLMDGTKYRPEEPSAFGEPGDRADEPFASAVAQLATSFAGARSGLDQ